jgi:dTDP-4-amino-4,6-dideoxygalactose transaminase
VIPFIDLAAQHAPLQPALDRAIAEVMASGEFVLGQPVARFEERFADLCGARWGVGVNSGSSALHLALLAAGVGPGHEVITTAFTFLATAAAIAYTGASPVLVDITDDGFTIDPARIAAAITPRTRAIVPVHLYGQPADLDPILAIARRHGLAVIEDAAQAHGAEYKGRRIGGLGDAACFSFYPTKNLGACGEAGMVVTSHPEIAEFVRRARSWEQTGADRHLARGFNYRMDALQGAMLGVKLPHLAAWNEARRAHARRYDEALAAGPLLRPAVMSWARHVYHIYAVRAPNRSLVQQELRRRGIETRIHYPTPLHLHESCQHLGYRAGDFPAAERAAAEVLSIPVHAELSADQVEAIAGALSALQPAARPKADHAAVAAS